MKIKRILAIILGIIMPITMGGCSLGDLSGTPENPSISDDDNSPQAPEVKPALVLSQESGAYASAFDLNITPSNETNKIYYTIDGSVPTINSLLYNDKISIAEETNGSYPLTNGVRWDPDNYGYYNFGTGNSATVLRLLEVDANGKEVARKTATYFIGKQFTLPVVSLSLPIDNALSFYNDIEKESKERAEMAYFDFASGERFALNTQIKIGGNWTKGYAYRTMNVNFNKDENGKKNTPVKAKLFGDRAARDGSELTGFKRFRLHAGGNAQVTNWFGDAFTQRVAAEVPTEKGEYLQVATTGYRPCEVYLNGEYWGLYAIREHYSDVYFEQNYGVDKDEVLLVDRVWNLTLADEQKDPNAFNFKYKFELAEDNDAEDGSGMAVATGFFDYLMTTDFSDDANYAELDTKMDLVGLADMILVHFYAGDRDFMNNNIKMWRTDKTDAKNPYADGKWRFCLHDLDFAFESEWGDNNVRDKYGNPANAYKLTPNFLDWYLGIAMLNWSYLDKEEHCLFSAPMQNAKFRELLYERAKVVREIYMNARVQSILSEMQEEIAEPMQRHVSRWGRYDYNYDKWLYHVYNTSDILYWRNCLRDNGSPYFSDHDYFLRQVASTIERYEATL